MRRTAAAFILIISLLLAGLAIAGPFEEALKACDRGDHMTEYGLIESLADQGNASAQYHLGVMYDDGHGVPQDYNKASMWYEMAAGKGNAKAMFNIGEMYASGNGVPQDYVLAYMWFTLAASHYPASGVADRNNVAIKINEIALKMVPEEIAEAQRMAREWKPKKEK